MLFRLLSPKQKINWDPCLFGEYIAFRVIYRIFFLIKYSFLDSKKRAKVHIHLKSNASGPFKGISSEVDNGRRRIKDIPKQTLQIL